MSKLYKLLAKPKLKSPNLIAAWPGISNVATIVGTYLGRKLDFKDLVDINDSYFFDPIGITVRSNLIEDPQFPRSRFYYYKNKEGKKDLILFMGDDQPSSKSYELSNLVIDVAQRFQVSRIYTCAAALTRIHHTEQPRVLAATTSHAVAEDIKPHNLVMGGNLQISGLNGLLLGVAKERGLDGLCLLGEVPSYSSRMPNPIAALAIINVLTKMLDIEVDTLELVEQASAAKSRMKQVATEAMEEYIDFFTEPIWEHDEFEENEEN
jgi:proteasome assembly chaperone (PAC2) family protein